ncbi:MAG: right-handed parallel beta-helix repeat-containing protein [Candidatus Cloacimonetes bacterium]|nr:right-handed parallel beta-helix repeat-containing protein [Candidatus Cloacimonadota bacterium]
MKKKIIFCLIVLSFVVLYAADYYVDPTGSNTTGDGSAGNPWRTIQYAVDNVSNPTTTTVVIHLSASTFSLWNDVDATDDVDIDRNFTDMNIIGAGSGTTIVEGHVLENAGTDRLFEITSNEKVTFEDLTLRHGKLTDMGAPGNIDGAAIKASDNCVIEINNCVVSNNIASGSHGGGIALFNSSELSLNNCTLSDNRSIEVNPGFYGGHGAVIYMDSCTLTAMDCTFDDNLSTYGGVFFTENTCTVTIDNSGFDGNNAFGGGAFNCDETDLTLSNCTISNCPDGGGIEIFNGTLELTNCTVNGNTDDGEGGGIDSYATDMTLTNCTIHNNTSGDEGGGIYYNALSTLIITNCTVAHNECDPSRNGGGIYQSGGAIHIKNTMLANNIGMGGTRNDFYMSTGSKNDNGYNIVEASNQTFSAAGDITGNQSNLNLSAVLQDNHTTNGTQTLALTTNSVAINAGNSGAANNGIAIPVLDQRSTARNGTTDIGAYEYWGNGGANPANPNGEPENHVLGFDGDYTADIDLTWANNDGAQPPCGYLIIGSEGSITDPVDGTDYTDDTDLRGNPGYGVVHVAHGETDYSFSFFDELSSYDFKIYPYTNSGTIIDYKINGSVPSTTVPTFDVDPEPTNHVTGFHADPYNPTEIDCYWTENDGAQAPDGYLIKASTGAVIDPVDGVDPADDTNLTDGGGNVKVLHGNTGYYFNNCSSETTYNFKIYPYTNSGAYIDFKTDAVVPSDDATTPAAPIEPVAGDLIITEIVGDDVHPEPMSGFMEIYNLTLNTLNLNNVEIRYYDNGSAFPSVTMLFGFTLASHDYFVIAQDQFAFETAYGTTPDYSEFMFPFDGGSDAIEIYVNDAKAESVDQFNEIGGAAWSWSGDEPLERNTTGYGGNSSAWTENTGGSGSPGEENDTPLPITLSSFTAQMVGGTSTLMWTTASETNNSGWNVYRSLSEIYSQAEKINQEIIQGAGSSSEPTDYIFEDKSILEYDMTYHYWIESKEYSGSTQLFGPISLYVLHEPDNPTPPVIIEIGLHQNYPNPFNPETTIRFALDYDSIANLAIYNTKGQLVKSLFRGTIEKNIYQDVLWNGKDNNDNQVSNGIYFYKLETSRNDFIRKMILMK